MNKHWILTNKQITLPRFILIQIMYFKKRTIYKRDFSPRFTVCEKMEVRGAAIFFICVSWFSLGLAEYVEVRVKGVTSIATTDDNFICATLDWWPADKCDYDQCPWGKAGIFNLVCSVFFSIEHCLSPYS